MAAFATGVPLDIYEFHLYTENSTSSPELQSCSFERTSSVEPRDFTPDLQDRLHALYAQ